MAKADVKLEFDANLTPFEKKTKRSEERIKSLEKQVGRLTKKLGATSKASQRAGISLAAFSKGGGAKFSGVLTTLTTKLGALVGGAGLMRAFTTVMSELGADSADAAKGIADVESNMRKLLQITSDLPEFEALRQSARDLSKSVGIPFAKALDITAQADAAGLGPKRTRTLTLAAQQFGEDPQAVIEALVTLKANFPKRGTEDIFDKVLAASENTKKGLIKTAEAAARAGPGAKSVQATLTETLALSAALIDAETSVERVATVFNQLAAAAVEGGVEDKGVLGGLQAFQKDQPAEFEKFRKSNKEFGRAFAALPAALERLPAIEKKIAESAGTVARKTALGEADPTLRTLEDSRQRTAVREEAERGRGIRAVRLEEAKKDVSEARRAAVERLPLLKPLAAAVFAFENIGLLLTDTVRSIEERASAREHLAFRTTPRTAPRGDTITVGGEEMEVSRFTFLLEQAQRGSESVRLLEQIARNTASAGGVGTMTDARRLELANEGNR